MSSLICRYRQCHFLSRSGSTMYVHHDLDAMQGLQSLLQAPQWLQQQTSCTLVASCSYNGRGLIASLRSSLWCYAHGLPHLGMCRSHRIEVSVNPGSSSGSRYMCCCQYANTLLTQQQQSNRASRNRCSNYVHSASMARVLTGHSAVYECQ